MKTSTIFGLLTLISFVALVICLFTNVDVSTIIIVLTSFIVFDISLLIAIGTENIDKYKKANGDYSKLKDK